MVQVAASHRSRDADRNRSRGHSTIAMRSSTSPPYRLAPAC
jgi:hypothetical protein